MSVKYLLTDVTTVCNGGGRVGVTKTMSAKRGQSDLQIAGELCYKVKSRVLVFSQ